MAKYYCEKCHRMLDEQQFYKSNNMEKYPDGGRLTQCRKCLTMHVDNFDPSTFLWILEELDIPYIEEEWVKLIDKYCVDLSKVTGATIMGRYVAKMHLKQWRQYRWKDTDQLNREVREPIEQKMRERGMSEEEIETEFYKKSLASRKPDVDLSFDGTYDVPEPIDPEVEKELEQVQKTQEHEKSIEESLTEEDKQYLFLKWGGSYSPAEWVQLEKFYDDVTQSFDIQTPTHIDYLKLICKTSLKCNQLIDANDIEGFQKMSRVYDNLMKSAKFTASQIKSESGDFVDSVGELVAMAEESGEIPQFYQDTPNDKIDAILDDTRRYLYKLVDGEQGLGLLIENAAKQLQDQEEKLGYSDSGEDDPVLEEDMIAPEDEVITDLDFEEFSKFIEDEQNKDEGSIYD